MAKIKHLFKHVRVWILLAFLIMAIVAIYPNPSRDGVAVRAVTSNSSAAFAGMASPAAKAKPMAREVITSINNKLINDVSDYEAAINGLTYNRTVSIKTNKGSYTLQTRPLYQVTVLNETELVTFERTEVVNETVNGTLLPVNKAVNVTEERPKVQRDIIGMEPLGLRVYDAPTSNLVKGLDLQGGTRVLLKPEVPLSSQDMETLLLNMEERLNVYGLSDIKVRDAADLSGEQFIVVEIAGATEEEVKDLLAKQGKFEAKIGNTSVFKGGGDVLYVCRSSECSFVVDPNRGGCSAGSDGSTYCTFSFQITLSGEAAQRQAEATKLLKAVDGGNGEFYLDKSLDLYLDDALVDSLRIGSELQGRPVTDISISGSGAGKSRQAAIEDSSKNMKKLQTILITGSLPVKLEIVKVDTISPALGASFLNNAILVGVLAILCVAVVIFIRYREIRITVPIMVTMVSEIVMLLGLAALIGWNLDLAAIAGIIVAAGTGVDDQIVITDEVLRKEKSLSETWRERMKRAFFIIFAAYITTVVAMLPLLFAGAGLLKLFALTTIAGVTFGVLIARPAYAAIIEILLSD